MITLDEARRRATLRVPEAAHLLGISDDIAYRAAANGELPVLRLGRRLVVPAAKFLALLGETPDMRTAGPASPAAATTDPGERPADAAIHGTVHALPSREARRAG